MYQVRFAQQSNAADWIDTIQLTSEDDDTPIDLAGAAITLQVWMQTQRGVGTGLGAWNGLYMGNSTPVLEATTANGKITVPAAGVIQWTFRATELGNLAPANYEVGLILAKDGSTTQLILGQLPVVSGVIA